MKTEQTRPKLNRQILDEASAWFVEFRVGDVDSIARGRFDQWLRQSPEHIRAYMEIAKIYVELPAISSQRKWDIQELVAHARSAGNVVQFERTGHAVQPFSPTAESNCPVLPKEQGSLQLQPSLVKPRRAGASIARKSLAASIAIFCMAAALLTWTTINRYSTYTTQIGERRSITLADGSTIDLNVRSAVRVKLSKAERDVELIDGQALFEVAKDKARPFIVRSGGTLVRAVGTQFDVYRKKSGTTVTVVEGRVAVLTSFDPNLAEFDSRTGTSLDGEAHTNATDSSSVAGHLRESTGSGKSPAILVSAGEQVTVTGQAMSAPERADVAAATAWVQHRLVFDNSRLSDVVDDFNRYNTRQLVIEDRRLYDFHVSGVYSSTDPASLIRFLRAQPSIDVIETDADVRINEK